jgi:hypothetical protein
MHVDALACSKCSTAAQTVPMVVLAFLSDPAVVSKILHHLGSPATALALAPARSFLASRTLSRGLGFALPEDDVTSSRQEGDDAGDAGVPEPAIRPPPWDAHRIAGPFALPLGPDQA